MYVVVLQRKVCGKEEEEKGQADVGSVRHLRKIATVIG